MSKEGPNISLGLTTSSSGDVLKDSIEDDDFENSPMWAKEGKNILEQRQMEEIKKDAQVDWPQLQTNIKDGRGNGDEVDVVFEPDEQTKAPSRMTPKFFKSKTENKKEDSPQETSKAIKKYRIPKKPKEKENVLLEKEMGHANSISHPEMNDHEMRSVLQLYERQNTKQQGTVGIVESAMKHKIYGGRTDDPKKVFTQGDRYLANLSQACSRLSFREAVSDEQLKKWPPRKASISYEILMKAKKIVNAEDQEEFSFFAYLSKKKSIYDLNHTYSKYLNDAPTYVINSKKPKEAWKRKSEDFSTPTDESLAKYRPKFLELVRQAKGLSPSSLDVERIKSNTEQRTLQTEDDAIYSAALPAQPTTSIPNEQETINCQTYNGGNQSPLHEDEIARHQSVHVNGNKEVVVLDLPDIENNENDFQPNDNNFVRQPTRGRPSKRNQTDFLELVGHTERRKHKGITKDDNSDGDEWSSDNKRKKHNKGKQPTKSASIKKSPSKRNQTSNTQMHLTSSNNTRCPICDSYFSNDEIEFHAAHCTGTEEITVPDEDTNDAGFVMDQDTNDGDFVDHQRIVIHPPPPRPSSKSSKIGQKCPICQKVPNLKTRSLEEHVEICMQKSGNKGKKR